RALSEHKTLSISWSHYPLNNKGEYIFIRNSVPGLSSVCIPYHD
ncbi:hypothetical protein, partial [Escherichia coli]